ncbi:hypothetical protein P7D52_08410 [Enterococcus dongliensis]|uniref:MapZ extracellular domain-containing protein n=1 Tax=Enterococcus dongliensis TaxID=2559925 RepID=A0AAW8THN3_9ENTE|nr:hypothetical protein [Enterococcus dongliensis]MDT2596899.1 hypothetical protein [Enterococcus dongliensis]MDT2634699.1 hypothetical protein [Enterococcus dongliensis]MDT2637751.1 hypothetical protein [Enterococcus dongliensis]MDT2642809.1 hypothetical protein [Enterococcus dongliensis]MDT2647901.1 hypothetical protein [Enterococcus dongliensis]
MKKKTIGWILLGLVVFGAVSFASYHIYQEKMIQSEKANKEMLNKRLTELYEDQQSGYFKPDISSATFDDLATEVKNQRGDSRTLEDIAQAKQNFEIQIRLNDLFERDVLNGLDLSAHPVLKEPKENQIQTVKEQLKESSAKEKEWGQDIAMLLSIAETQSKDFSSAENDVENLVNKGSDLTLSDYLTGVKTLAVLPDGKFKQQLLDKLAPVKNQLANENANFATQIQQSDASMENAKKNYQERQAKVLAERNKELTVLKKELMKKQETYDSYKDALESLEDSKKEESSRKEAEDSRSHDSDSHTSSESSDSNSSEEAEDD